MKRRTEHRIDKGDIEITLFELKRIFEHSSVPLDELLYNIFCSDCMDNLSKKLIDYIPYINKLNDTILRGKCSSCGEPAARYLETGESADTVEIVTAIRKQRLK